MTDDYIITGTGIAVPEYLVTTKDLQEAIDSGFLEGFDEPRILDSKGYKALPDFAKKSPLEYFVENVLGFCTRYHVNKYPPKKSNGPYGADSLAVESIEKALQDANLKAYDIDAWIISTTTGPTRSPGLADVVKAELAGNLSMTRTLTSGCGGFILGLQDAYRLMLTDKEIETVVVCHSETMSLLLAGNNDIITHATFGDGAGAVILSRMKDGDGKGLRYIETHQNPKFIGHLGVDKNNDLVIHPRQVKKYAVEDMKSSIVRLLDTTGLSISEIDVYIPHQTGTHIVSGIAKEMDLPADKIHTDVQKKYGNTSGATIPMALDDLGLTSYKSGTLLLGVATGVGGQGGAFLYEVP